MTAAPAAGRLFLGVPLTEEVRRGLVAHFEQALGNRAIPGRRVPPENWHLTVRFLGDTPPETYERMLAAMGAASFGDSFVLTFGCLGAFPRPKRARVLWLGAAEGAAELTALAAVVEQCVVRAGFESEKRRFSAHLTLSRLRPEQDVRALIDAVPPFPMQLHVHEFVVYRSHLSPSGARYEPLHRFALAENPREPVSDS